MEFLNELDKQAVNAGGAVISLLGNHELMNADGNMSHVSYEDLSKLSKKERTNSFKPGGQYAKLLACSRLPAVIIGSFIFVHAGFIEPFMRHLRLKDRDDLYKISVTLRKWLLGLIDKNNVVNIERDGENYLVDQNDDGKWDYVYNLLLASLVPYSEQPSNKGVPLALPWWLFVIIGIIVIVILIVFYLFKTGRIYVYEEYVVEE
jgi:hypothetical protein